MDKKAVIGTFSVGSYGAVGEAQDWVTHCGTQDQALAGSGTAVANGFGPQNIFIRQYQLF